jgi:carbon-monoxide dehydrogenase small subunit
MTALALLEEGIPIDDDELREHLSGNLCRCTGYQSIVDGVRLAAHMLSEARRRDGPGTSPVGVAIAGQETT